VLEFKLFRVLEFPTWKLSLYSAGSCQSVEFVSAGSCPCVANATTVLVILSLYWVMLSLLSVLGSALLAHCPEIETFTPMPGASQSDQVSPTIHTLLPCVCTVRLLDFCLLKQPLSYHFYHSFHFPTPPLYSSPLPSLSLSSLSPLPSSPLSPSPSLSSPLATGVKGGTTL